MFPLLSCPDAKQLGERKGWKKTTQGGKKKKGKKHNRSLNLPTTVSLSLSLSLSQSLPLPPPSSFKTSRSSAIFPLWIARKHSSLLHYCSPPKQHQISNTQLQRPRADFESISSPNNAGETESMMVHMGRKEEPVCHCKHQILIYQGLVKDAAS